MSIVKVNSFEHFDWRRIESAREARSKQFHLHHQHGRDGVFTECQTESIMSRASSVDVYDDMKVLIKMCTISYKCVCNKLV